VAKHLKAKHPTVPVVYFANGGSGYLAAQTDMSVDGLSIDWRITMARARELVGPKLVLAGESYFQSNSHYVFLLRYPHPPLVLNYI
jgi:uroporphyrinogen-III decarboxylase